MKKRDFRKLSASSQYEIKIAVIKMLRAKKTQKEVASYFSVRQQTVSEWWIIFKREGLKGLRNKVRGRRKGEKRNLSKNTEKEIKRLIVDRCPEQLKLPFVLWTREAVKELIKMRYNLKMPIRTVGEYLKRWGFTPKKPVKRAYEQQPQEVKKWLNETYPVIAEEAQALKAEIHWCDETGVSSEANVCRGYSPVGIKPVMKTSGKRFSVSMISTITNQGQLRYMMYKGGLRVNTFLVFLKRLLKSSEKTIYLILDNLRVHHAKDVSKWLAEQQGKIKLFFLPPYCPEYNPDEYVNQDMKLSISKKLRPTTDVALKANVSSHMKSLSKKSGKVINFFKHEKAVYAAAR